MKSAVSEILPARVRRSLVKLGHDVALARKKRRLTVAMMLERTGVSKQTYQRVERGDPKVALGTYAMVCFVLGFGDVFGAVLDRTKDSIGLLADDELVPKRVRPRKDAPP